MSRVLGSVVLGFNAWLKLQIQRALDNIALLNEIKQYYVASGISMVVRDLS